MSPVRYAHDDLGMALDLAGRYVLFADVEPALRDSARLAWLLPVISGDDTPVADARTNALSAGVLAGLTGVALVDHAMERCP